MTALLAAALQAALDERDRIAPQLSDYQTGRILHALLAVLQPPRHTTPARAIAVHIDATPTRAIAVHIDATRCTCGNTIVTLDDQHEEK